MSADAALAAEWLLKAAVQGNSGAQLMLGKLYMAGEGVKPDYMQASAWLQSALKGGEVGTIYPLARMMELGLGSVKHKKAALSLYLSAAEAGDAEAQDRLGMVYFNGDLAQKDSVKALEWLKQSAEQSYARGEYHYGTALIQLKKMNAVEALSWVGLAARQDDDEAKHFLAKWLPTLTNNEIAAYRLHLQNLITSPGVIAPHSDSVIKQP